ncbi:MAG TPA: hypothetical protein VM577_07415 [Anaerovoracaceae bacterium]|nr:hypothetical protein [Anaerovoracaceae bacterium]
MSNSMKILTRTLIILVLMIAGSWLNAQLTLPGFTSSIAVYVVYLLIGIILGSMANPRFTKAKNKWIYVLPILIFAVIGALTMLYPWLHVGAWPFGIGAYLQQFSNLSWTIAGFFLSIALR